MVKQAKPGNSKLRFAALRRVSTEQQEKTGESLRTQKADIEKYVEQLGGTIFGWYGGQEHATPGWEKKEIDRLLNDAQKTPKLFDAVIVAFLDRWSRDNEKSKEGLNVFKANDIRFFVATMEYDLYNPEHRFILGMSAEAGQLIASKGKSASIKSRISRAERGIPTGGKLPYGRTFDEETGKWGIDKDKQAQIKTIARRYLAGEQLPLLADEYGMNHSNLHKVLTQRSGDSWALKFNVDDLKIHEEVSLKIPRLLDDETIKAIRKRAEANKTFRHGRAKHQYLLARIIFCEHCGYAMFGQTNHNGHRYYRHCHIKRERECNVPKGWIPADEIEESVMAYLFEIFGNAPAMQRAIEEAIPNREKIKEYQQRLEEIDGQLNKVKAGKDRIHRLILNETITDSEIANMLAELKQKETRLLTEKQQLDENLEGIPTPEKIEAMSKKIADQFSVLELRLSVKAVMLNAPEMLNRMPYKDKLELVRMVFSGKTFEGKRMGTYIEWQGKKEWRFNIHGHLIDEVGLRPVLDPDVLMFSREYPEHRTQRQKQLVAKGSIKNTSH